MEVAFGQSQEFAKRAGVLHDAEHGTRWAVAAESAPAPGTGVARNIDFADDAFADEVLRIGFDDFAHEFVARDAGESVIATPQFEIGVADAGLNQADEGEALGPFRLLYLPDLNSAGVQVD